MLTTLTVPARQASVSPGIPSVESERNSNGSQKPASTRRKITWTGTQPPTVRSPTRPFRTGGRIPGPADSRVARPSTRARRRFPTAHPATGSRSTGRPRRRAHAPSSADRSASMNGVRRWTPVVRKRWANTRDITRRFSSAYAAPDGACVRWPSATQRPSAERARSAPNTTSCLSPGRRMPSQARTNCGSERIIARRHDAGAQQPTFTVEVAAVRDRAVRPAGSCRVR